MQRAGRGGRNTAICARAILLVQPSVFQEVKPASKAPHLEASDVKYRKDVEVGLREWIETEECRRDASDDYFDDGIPRKGLDANFVQTEIKLTHALDPSGICCDNCLRKTNPSHPLLQPAPNPLLDMPNRSASPSSDTEDSPVQEADDNGKRPMAEGAKVANRREKHLQGAKDLLMTWRFSTWMEMYRRRPWGVQCLLPDAIVTVFATKARLETIDDLEGAGWSPTHAKRHGDAVLRLLREYDESYHQEREAEKRENAEKRRAETLVRQQAKKDEKKAQAAQARIIRAALRASQPKKPRPSRAKKAPRVALSDIPCPDSPMQAAGPSTPRPTPVPYWARKNNISTPILTSQPHTAGLSTPQLTPIPHWNRENVAPAPIPNSPALFLPLRHMHDFPYHLSAPHTPQLLTSHAISTTPRLPQISTPPITGCVTPSSFYGGSFPSPFMPEHATLQIEPTSPSGGSAVTTHPNHLYYSPYANPFYNPPYPPSTT